MSGYNDGSSFGYDEINPYDHIPISFEQTTLASGRPMLLSNNEYPRAFAKNTGQLDEVTRPFAPTVYAPKGMIEGFSGGTHKWSTDDQQLILMFLLVVIVVLQTRMMMQMEYMRHREYNPHHMHPASY